MIDMDEARTLLEERRRSLRELAGERLEPEERMTDVAADRGQVDSDMAAELGQRETEESVDDLLEVHIDRIEEAFDRVDEGSWGICAECGRRIPDERLRARPETRYCIQHSAIEDTETV